MVNLDNVIKVMVNHFDKKIYVIWYLIENFGILDSNNLAQDECGGDTKHVGIGKESGCTIFAD